MLGLKFLCLVLATVVLVQEGSCVIWGSKDSRSGVRGVGQRTPQVLDLAVNEESLEQGLKDISSRLMDTDSSSSERRHKRQSTSSNIGHTTRLTNDNHLQAIVHWTGHPSEYLFIVTRKVNGSHSEESWLWRSTDYGHTFVNETSKFPDSAVVEWYYISPFSEYLIFADIKNKKLYITEDEGDTYSIIDIAFTPNRLLFQSVLAPSSSSTYSRYLLGYDSTSNMLWASCDLGITWKLIGSNVPANRYHWRRLDIDVEGNLSTVYFEMKTNTNSNKSMLYSVRYPYSMVQLFSSDLGEFQSESFVLEYEYLFVQKANPPGSPLWVSYRRNTTFKQAGFHLVTGNEQYSVIDASEGQVFMAVYHDINTTNLYISEELGTNYTLSLEDILSPPVNEWIDGNPTFDVHVVEGIVGTYFANLHISGSTFGSTVVSYDKGGIWNQLSPPAVDRHGHPLVCPPPDCSLHLHINRDNYGYQSILSQDSAIGLIMAQGNLGSTLSSSSRYNRLYFSRDGGFTWAEVQSGNWEFQFAALGSVVVAVKRQSLIKTVLWTCDEGATVMTTTFVSTEFPRGIVVVGMRTEIREKSRHVTVFGYDIFGGFTEWLVIDVNFTSVISRQCDPDQDYFNWVPTDERPGGRCLLGEVVTYERRNSSVCCYVDPEYEKPINRTPCICAIEDFECDYGFDRENLNSPCNALPGVPYPPSPPTDCPETGNYTYTSGYRKVAGDKCVPGSENYFLPRITPCPILPPELLIINHSPPLVQAGHTVMFTLTQYKGATLSTAYTWNFNDSTAVLQITGLQSAMVVSHTFVRPGVYNVSITATNHGGSSDTTIPLTVLDILRSVSIVPPSEVFNGQVPTSISLIFIANMTTVFGTNMLQISGYTWDFGDNSANVGTDSITVSHMYTIPGTYTISLVIHLPFYEDNQDVFNFEVYEAAALVDITTSNDSITRKDDRLFALVGPTITFHSVAAQDSTGEIPPDATYMWHVAKTSSVRQDNFTGSTFTYVFPSSGDYIISVIGTSAHDTNIHFAGQLYVTAQLNIIGATISHVPTVRSGMAASFQVSATSDSVDGKYFGTVHVSAMDDNGTVLDYGAGRDDGSPTQITIYVKGRGNVGYWFKVENAVSSTLVYESIISVVAGDYGQISLVFETEALPSNFNTTDWQNKLSNSAVNSIVSIHKLLNPELIEVESIRLILKNTTLPDKQNSLKKWTQHSLKKRHNEEVTLYLIVDVNILPDSYTRIDVSKLIAKQIVSEANNGSLIIVVNGATVPISSSSERSTDPLIIIEPEYVVDAKKYAAIGGSLGTLLVLAVLFTVSLILGIYFYRRKYSRLSVRYSRLQQTPVRFTFTPGGDMVEEELSDDEDDDIGAVTMN